MQLSKHLETLLAERAQLVAAVGEYGMVRERPLVKAGETIAMDLVANPLLREVRAIDDQIVKLMALSADAPDDDPLAEFLPGGHGG